MLSRVMLSLILSCFCYGACACSGPPQSNTNASNSSSAPAKPTAAPGARLAPLPAYNVEWISQQVPSEMQAAKWYDATITLKNPTSATWAAGTGTGVVNIAYHWLPAQGEKPTVFDGERTALPRDIGPGETVTINKVLVIAPPSPGAYRLQISLVQEGMTWFESQGVTPLTVPVTVR